MSNKSDLRIYVASLLAASSLKEIQIRHSGISIKKREIGTCYWNVATYKWKIDFISILIKASFLIGTEMEIFDNISSTRRCLALQNNTNVVRDCSSTYNFSCEGSGEWKP
jgi:hypothetical protein